MTDPLRRSSTKQILIRLRAVLSTLRLAYLTFWPHSPKRVASMASLLSLCVTVENVRGPPRYLAYGWVRINPSRVQTSIGHRSFAFYGPTVSKCPICSARQ